MVYPLERKKCLTWYGAYIRVPYMVLEAGVLVKSLLDLILQCHNHECSRNTMYIKK